MTDHSAKRSKMILKISCHPKIVPVPMPGLPEHPGFVAAICSRAPIESTSPSDR